jgi:hypothetical protein
MVRIGIAFIGYKQSLTEGLQVTVPVYCEASAIVVTVFPFSPAFAAPIE